MENQAPTIAQVINQIMTTAGLIISVTAPATFGLIEALKSMGLRTRFIGIISIILGFFIALLFCKILLPGSSFFLSINIGIAIIASFVAPGTYSALKSLKKEKEVIE